MAKVLVTGGAGFIGSNLVDMLVDLNHNVIVVDNLSSGQIENVNSKARFIEEDINNDLNDVFANNFDYVFHLAAQINVRESLKNPIKDAETNILGSLNLINESVDCGVKKFIFSSTGGAIYSPDAEIPCDEESEQNPLSPYGLGKFTVENYLRIFRNIHNLNYTALRYSNVFGPRQNSKGEAGVVSIFIDNALAGKPLNVFGDGEQTRDYVYVKDVVDANVMAMNLSGVYNVATNTETSVNDLAERIKKLTDSDSEIVYSPAINGELKRSRLSYDKISSEGWKPEYDLNAGLEDTVKWFRERVKH